jgi:hypothetical protein
MQSWPRVASASICGLTNAATDGRSEVPQDGSELVLPQLDAAGREPGSIGTRGWKVNGLELDRHHHNHLRREPRSWILRGAVFGGVTGAPAASWHAYRRKWATERKELPLKDVAKAGGWKDVTTLLTCYQHADEATMLRVMASPAKLVGRRAAGSLEKL